MDKIWKKYHTSVWQIKTFHYIWQKHLLNEWNGTQKKSQNSVDVVAVSAISLSSSTSPLLYLFVFPCAVSRGQSSSVVHHGWVWLPGAALWPAQLRHGSLLLHPGHAGLLCALASAGPAGRRWEPDTHSLTLSHTHTHTQVDGGILKDTSGDFFLLSTVVAVLQFHSDNEKWDKISYSIVKLYQWSEHGRQDKG